MIEYIVKPDNPITRTMKIPKNREDLLEKWSNSPLLEKTSMDENPPTIIESEPTNVRVDSLEDIDKNE